MLNAVLLMVNMLGYFLGHYPQNFDLSDEQRSLILQTIIFFVWLGGGAGVFTHLEPGWVSGASGIRTQQLTDIRATAMHCTSAMSLYSLLALEIRWPRMTWHGG